MIPVTRGSPGPRRVAAVNTTPPDATRFSAVTSSASPGASMSRTSRYSSRLAIPSDSAGLNVMSGFGWEARALSRNVGPHLREVLGPLLAHLPEVTRDAAVVTDEPSRVLLGVRHVRVMDEHALRLAARGREPAGERLSVLAREESVLEAH